MVLLCVGWLPFVPSLLPAVIALVATRYSPAGAFAVRVEQTRQDSKLGTNSSRLTHLKGPGARSLAGGNDAAPPCLQFAADCVHVLCKACACCV